MQTERMVIPGVVRNGVIVPEHPSRLPEGTEVDIIVASSRIPRELQEEFEDWERLSDEAWSLIEQWEKEEANGSR